MSARLAILYASFYPVNHPAYRPQHLIHTDTAPTHVTISFMENNKHLVISDCTPEMCYNYLDSVWSPHFAFIWHWKDDSNEFTDYMVGIKFYRNKEGLLHRAKYPAVIFAEETDIPLNLYQGIIIDFLKKSTTNLGVAFKFPAFSTKWAELTLQFLPAMPPHLDPIIQNFMSGISWYVWNGERIFINQLNGLDLLCLKKPLPIAVKQLNSVINKCHGKPLSDIVRLIKRWAYIIDCDPYILFKACNIIDDDTPMQYTASELAFLEDKN